MLRGSFRAGLLAVALLLAAFSASASAYTFGSPDATFGANGVVNFKPTGSGYGGINAMAVQPDGKIVVAGQGEPPNYDGWIARFTPSGALDTAFNGSGVYAFQTPGFKNTQLQSVALQPDGKIVVGGLIVNSGSNANWGLLLRLNPDGTLDTSSDSTPASCFASGCLGYILRFAATGDADFNDVAVLPGGDILAAGTHVDGAIRPDLLRYSSDGTFDATFSGNAATTLGGFSAASGDPTHIRILQPADGNFIVAFGGSGSFDAVKLTSTGTSFSGFGNAGHWSIGASIGFADAVLRPNGSILFVGSQSAAPYQVLTLGSIDENGETDVSIGAGGISAVDIAGERSNGMSARVLADGRFFVLTLGFTGGGSTPFVLTSVFTPNGQPDPSYGTGGTIRHTAAGGYEYPTALELLPGDKPLLAGTNFDIPSMTNFGLITKLHGPNDPDPIAPVSTIKSPSKSKYKAKKLTKFSGQAAPAGKIAKVEIALQRVDSKLLKKKRRCLWLSSNKAKFKKNKAVKKKCSTPRWLNATGTDSWSYRLKKKLPAGSYVLQVRATATDGNVQTAPKVKKFKIT